MNRDSIYMMSVQAAFTKQINKISREETGRAKAGLPFTAGRELYFLVEVPHGLEIMRHPRDQIAELDALFELSKHQQGILPVLVSKMEVCNG